MFCLSTVPYSLLWVLSQSPSLPLLFLPNNTYAVLFPTHMQISMLQKVQILAFVVSAFSYVQYNLFCHDNVIQQQGQAECTMHRLYCYKQHDNNHTTLWIKIILSTGVMIIPFLVWNSCHFGMEFIPFWYENHTVFGMKIILFLVCSV